MATASLIHILPDDVIARAADWFASHWPELDEGRLEELTSWFQSPIRSLVRRYRGGRSRSSWLGDEDFEAEAWAAVWRVLELDGAGRFAFRWEGCLGTYGQHAGEVVRTGDELTLVLDAPAGSRIPAGTLMLALSRDWIDQAGRNSPEALRLVPVRWATRRYLIPRAAMRSFLDAVSRGREPRTGIHGDYMLSVEHRQGFQGLQLEAVAGYPELPPEWSTQLPARPERV